MGTLRTCVGCRETGPSDPLLRVVLGPEGTLVPDLGSRAFGRGAWVHARLGCLKQAASGGFARSFRTKLRVERDTLLRSLRSQAERRAHALIGAALRARRVRVGPSAVRDALAAGEVRLTIVACDATGANAARLLEQPGLRARRFGSEQELGRTLGREAVTALAILDEGLALALEHALGVVELGAPGAEGSARAGLVTEAG